MELINFDDTKEILDNVDGKYRELSLQLQISEVLDLIKYICGGASKLTLQQQIEKIRAAIIIELHHYKRMNESHRLLTRLKKLINRDIDEKFIASCIENGVKMHPHTSRKQDPNYYTYDKKP